MRAVVDSNVVLVANNAHEDVSPDCVLACIERLQAIMKDGRLVIDDAYRILGEYQQKTAPMKRKGPGDVFVRWALQNSANANKIEQVALTESSPEVFDEIGDAAFQQEIDSSDRKFIAAACGHSEATPILQATDCKWLDWWERLHPKGVSITFICTDDICRFYSKKFPKKTVPQLPG